VLSTLSVAPYDRKHGAAHFELELEKDRNLRMANLLGFSLDPKRDTREVSPPKPPPAPACTMPMEPGAELRLNLLTGSPLYLTWAPVSALFNRETLTCRKGGWVS
jgi:hypothetical protein